MKALCVLLLAWSVTFAVQAETIRLSVPYSDNQSQEENGLAATKALNDWEVANPDREVITTHWQFVLSRVIVGTALVKSMLTGVIVTHRQRREVGPALLPKS